MYQTDSATRDNIRSYYQPVEMPGGWSFDTAATLKRIDLYYNSKFEKGQYDRQGFRKFFYNIVKPACDVATKFIDLDTKDIILDAEHPDDEFKVWLYQQDLKNWMKQEEFGCLLNEISQNSPKYGHIVLKVFGDDEMELVNIHNIRTNPSASKLSKSNFVYEPISMFEGDMREMGWDTNSIDELVSRGREKEYLVYVCYDRNPEKGKKWVMRVVGDLFASRDNGSVVRGTEALINDKEAEFLPTIELYREEVDELPYREFKFEDVPGRWLGLGFVEYLFDNQIRRNELVNIKAKGLYYTSLKLYQTRDETVGKNILTEVENGDILRITSEVTPILNEERNLQAFRDEEEQWDKNKVEKTFTSDISRGENLPSRTPLGVANIQASMVTSYFDLKRENYGLFVKELILEDIIPRFAAEANKEHVLMFSGSEEELAYVDKALAEDLVRVKDVKRLVETGFSMPDSEKEIMKQEVIADLGGRRGRFFKIGDNFYKDAKYIVDVIVTGEQLDSGALQTTLNTAMQIIGSNPAVMENPTVRSVFFKMLKISGVSPIDLKMLSSQMKNTPPPASPPAQGGSISPVPAGPSVVNQPINNG